MKKSIKIGVIIVASIASLIAFSFIVIHLISYLSPFENERDEEYINGVRYSAFPEEIFELYEDAVVYRYDENKDEMTLYCGSEDNLEDIIEFYEELLKQEDFMIRNQSSQEARTYWIEGLLIDEGFEFYLSIEEADGRKEEEYYESQFKIVLILGDDSTTSNYNYELQPRVSSISLDNGTMGTWVNLSGSDLDNMVLDYILLGDIQIVPEIMSGDNIGFIVPSNATSGDIQLVYDETMISVGAFIVNDIESELLLSKEILSNDTPVVVESDEVVVTLPLGLLKEKRTLEVEKIINIGMANLPFDSFDLVYDISIDDIHEFDDYFTIEIMLPEGSEGYPSVFYYDEDMDHWVSAEYEVTDNKSVLIYTNHLTSWGIELWLGHTYSSAGNFSVCYNPSDFENLEYDNMDAMAKAVGDLLEEVKNNYDSQLPEAMRESFTFMGFQDAMDVYIHSEYLAGNYSALTNNIAVPTVYDNQGDFEQTLAHELFHVYQDVVWSEIGIVGTLGRSSNRWAIEALAELAAYTIAYPGKYDMKIIEKDAFNNIKNMSKPTQPMTLLNDIHEYDMACFLQYLLVESGTSFSEMWIGVGQSSKSSVQGMFYEFFESKIEDFTTLESAYLDFWRSVVSDSRMPSMEDVTLIIDPMILGQENHSIEYVYKAKSANTEIFYSVNGFGFSLNVPKRIFCVEYIGDENGDAYISKVVDASETKNLINNRKIGGFEWEYIYKSVNEASEAYRLYELTNREQMLLVVLQGREKDATSSVRVSEIEVSCDPVEIEAVTLNQEYNFKYDFKNIFTHVNEVLVEVDFGGGNLTSFEQKLDSRDLSFSVGNIYDSTDIYDVACRLYDTTGGIKVLISEVIIPVGESISISLEANPKTVYVEEAIFFETTVTGDLKEYNFNYNFDDGVREKDESSTIVHRYEEEGTYSVSVEVETEKGDFVGKAFTNITVLPIEEVTTENKPDDLDLENAIIGLWTYIQKSQDIYTGEIYETIFAFEFYKGGGMMARYTPISDSNGANYFTDTKNILWEVIDSNTLEINIEGLSTPIYFDISQISNGKMFSDEKDDNGDSIVLEKQDY